MKLPKISIVEVIMYFFWCSMFYGTLVNNKTLITWSMILMLLSPLIVLFADEMMGVEK